MQSFIVTSKNLDKATKEAKDLSEKQKVNTFDIEILDFETLGIEDVRSIQKKIFLKPLKGERKSLILVLRTGITDEAQSSMLKLLEEPPPSSLIFLITANHLLLLPTILSRTTLIELGEDERELGSSLSQVLEIQTSGDALALAQELSKDKASAILWLEDLILSARDKMIKSLDDKKESLKIRKMIHEIELTHYNLKTTNANPRLALENLFLNLIKPQKFEFEVIL